MNPPDPNISALLITYNEMAHIEAVLENLAFANEIVVVDSFSTDGTAEVVRKHPKAQLVQRAFKSFTDQKTYALSQARHDWVLFIDADERVPPLLEQEILDTVRMPENRIAAYYFRRTFMFKDRVLRFSGWQSDKNYRLFRKSRCHFDPSRIVHETLIVDGASATLKHKLIHYSYASYESYKKKMVRYGQMRAIEEYRQGKRFAYFGLIFRPFYKFLNHYLIRLGILDGMKGIIISYLNALGVYARYKELNRLSREGTGSQNALFNGLVKEARHALNSGQLLLYPTDTVWGIGCDATDPEAVQQVYALKKRDDSKALICLASDLEMVTKYTDVPEAARSVLAKAERPTTIIYHHPRGLAANLVADDDTVAIRIASDPFCRELIQQFGKPIVSTSANPAGAPTPKCFDEIDAGILKGVDYVVNLSRDRIMDTPSRILKIEEDGSLSVIRE